ncbi:hypothetical protein NON20_24670 (plasmid) [Synechocystis sp. B12]|nr:hypothetical protein NON20_24670 [Synechocystis sp. B12]
MFFAKFDKEAYQSFGFKTITNAHQEIANILKVKPRTLENTRDNFDSQYNHPGGRKGHKDKKGSNTKK